MNPIKLARVKLDMKQEDLAIFLGVTQATVSQIETGQRVPTRKILEKLNDKLHLGDSENVDYEKELLYKNIDGLSCDAIRKINAVVELIKKGKR